VNGIIVNKSEGSPVTVQNKSSKAITAEQALRASQDTIRAFHQQVPNILERISDGFVALDTDWRFTYVNRKGEEIFRRLQKDTGSLLGKVIWDEFPRIVGTEIEAHYRRAVRDQVTVEFETHFAMLDAWYSIRAYPSNDGLSIYLLDISRRKRSENDRSKTETALRASEQHFRAAFNQAAVGMAVASLSGRVEEVNDRFVEILGYSRAEILDRSVLEITHPEDRHLTSDYIRRIKAGEIREFTYEKRFIRKDGAIVWALTSVTIIYDAAGNPERFIGIL